MNASNRNTMAIFMALVFVCMVSCQSALAHGEVEAGTPAPDSWTKNYTLIVTDAQNIDEAYEAADAVERAGGRVGVIVPNRVMLGWIPAGKARDLVGKHKILGVYRRPLLQGGRDAVLSRFSGPSADLALDEAEENAITFFNEVASGEYELKEMEAASQAGPESERVILADAFETPPISYRHYIRNLDANGITEETLTRQGISLTRPTKASVSPSPGNSDYMVGKILFNAIFVESNGAVDANEFTWTKAHRTATQSRIVAGLSWWASRAAAYKAPLKFVYRYEYNLKTRTSYEPIRHSHAQDDMWINQIMANFGFNSGSKFDRTAAFNTARRASLNTNWSVVSFIGYNPGTSPSTFTSGYFAYAYIRGPYSQLLFRNDGWGATGYETVNAHETGHLFGAADEYYQAGYGGCGSCDATTNGVLNGNCERCNTNSQPCMMKSNTKALCGYTPGQIGWRNVTSLSLKTCRTDNSVAKDFFAPGEAIKYAANFCVTGPRLDTTTHAVRIRFRADYFSGSLNSSTNVYDDTGWASAGSISLPATTGKACYTTSWSRSVPAGVAYGPATLNVQLELNGLGKQAASRSAKFYVAPGADTTQPSPMYYNPLENQAEPVDEGPFMEKASEASDD